MTFTQSLLAASAIVVGVAAYLRFVSKDPWRSFERIMEFVGNSCILLMIVGLFAVVLFTVGLILEGL